MSLERCVQFGLTTLIRNIKKKLHLILLHFVFGYPFFVNQVCHIMCSIKGWIGM